MSGECNLGGMTSQSLAAASVVAALAFLRAETTVSLPAPPLVSPGSTQIKLSYFAVHSQQR